MTRPVSVVMPVLNGAGTLAEALDSVLSQPEVGEVILVDDGSTDGSADIARGLADSRLRIVSGPRAGVARAYNAGYAEARLPYVAICDCDDVYVAGRLAWQAAFLDGAPEYVAVAGAFAVADARLRIRVPLLDDMPEGDVGGELSAGRPVSTLCAWLVRRDAARALGYRRPWFAVGCDLDFQYRLGGAGKVRFVPRQAYVYRLNEASITHRATLKKLRFYEEAATRFARQRGATGQDDLQRGCPPSFEPASDPGTANRATSQFAGHLMGYAHRLRLEGRYRAALGAAAQAVRADARSLATWRSLAGVALAGLRVSGRTGQRPDAGR